MIVIFEQNMQFWCTEIGNFLDHFIFLIGWLHFYTEIRKFPDNFITWTRDAIFIRQIFAFSRYLIKKHIVPINAACLPWPETTKFENRQKWAYTKILRQWQHGDLLLSSPLTMMSCLLVLLFVTYLQQDQELLWAWPCISAGHSVRTAEIKRPLHNW